MNGNNYWINLQSEMTKTTYDIIRHGASKTAKPEIAKTANQNTSACRFRIPELTQEGEDRIKQCEAKHGQGILILGDSHAVDLYGVVTSKFDHSFIVGLTRGGCRPHRPRDKCSYDEAKTFLSEHNVFEHVIFEQAGFYLLLDEQGRKGHREMFDGLLLSEEVKNITVNIENVNKVRDYLHELSEFVPITWFGSRVEPHITDRQILKYGCDFDFNLRENQEAPFNALDKHIQASITGSDNINFISQNKTIKYTFPRDFMNCDVKWWSDGDHLSDAGETRFAERLPDDFLSYL